MYAREAGQAGTGGKVTVWAHWDLREWDVVRRNLASVREDPRRDACDAVVVAEPPKCLGHKDE